MTFTGKLGFLLFAICYLLFAICYLLEYTLTS